MLCTKVAQLVEIDPDGWQWSTWYNQCHDAADLETKRTRPPAAMALAQSSRHIPALVHGLSTWPTALRIVWNEIRFCSEVIFAVEFDILFTAPVSLRLSVSVCQSVYHSVCLAGRYLVVICPPSLCLNIHQYIFPYTLYKMLDID